MGLGPGGAISSNDGDWWGCEYRVVGDFQTEVGGSGGTMCLKWSVGDVDSGLETGNG